MAKLVYDKTGRLLFTKEMKKDYTILIPMMAKIHFNIIKNVFIHYGYKAVLLETDGPEIAQVGFYFALLAASPSCWRWQPHPDSGRQSDFCTLLPSQTFCYFT